MMPRLASACVRKCGRSLTHKVIHRSCAPFFACRYKPRTCRQLLRRVLSISNTAIVSRDVLPRRVRVRRRLISWPIARVALPVAASAAFDYWMPDGLGRRPGALVRVRLAGRALAGVVVDVVPTSDVRTRKAAADRRGRGDDLPALPEDLLDLAEFVATLLPGAAGARAGADAAAARARPSRTAPSRRAVTALRLTEPGRSALPVALARAPRAGALFDEWKAAPKAILAARAFAALAPHLKNAVRRWEAAGWVEAVVAERVASATVATGGHRLRRSIRPGARRCRHGRSGGIASRRSCCRASPAAARPRSISPPPPHASRRAGRC